MKTPIEIARQRVADRYAQPYHKNAILSGDWDTGCLVQEELKAVLADNTLETPDAKAA